MKHVLHIFGASGAGTSTLGRKICEEFSWRFLDTDDCFWLPTEPKFSQKRPVSERLALMKTEIQRAEHLVIAGSLSGWGDELIASFTLAIRLETDTALRMERLKRREAAIFGTQIEKGGERYEQHQAFLAWADAYDEGGLNMRSKAMHDAWQKKLGCPLLVLNGGDDLEENLTKVKEALAAISKGGHWLPLR